MTRPARRPEPLTVEVRRGPLVESTHLVHAVVADASGAVVRSWGDVERRTHPRSAVKPLQALPLVETGAADHFALSEVELALACASHNGEPGHRDAVQAWLTRIGCSADDLDCGTQADHADHGPAANNCSGKHAGFLSVARHLAEPTAGYLRPDHPVQRLVTEALAQTCGVDLDPTLAGIDGCGIPAHAMPLGAIAASAARFAVPPGSWHPDRRDAARRLARAMVSQPWYVAGTDRLCTDLLVAGGGDVLVKVGAEGVQWAGLPGLGLGIACKVEDGSRRASEVAIGHVLDAVDPAGVHTRAAVFSSRHRLTNHAGTEVGSLHVSSPAT